MARQLRFDPPGGWHHVMHRGSRKQKIFVTEHDHLDFLDRVSDAGDRWGVEIHAYALMGNHYHLLVRSVDGTLSRAIQRLNSGHAQAFNQRHGVDGHLFRGRYRSMLIGSDRYLVEVARYIHRNPVKAHLVTSPGAYRWSSHRHFVEGAAPGWLHTDELLTRFGNDRARFDSFVRAKDTATARSVIEAVNARRPAIGPDDFLQTLHDSAEPDMEQRGSLSRIVPVNPDHIERAARKKLAPFRPSVQHLDRIMTFVLAEAGVAHSVIAARQGIDSAAAVGARNRRTLERAARDDTLRTLLTAAQTTAQTTAQMKMRPPPDRPEP